MVEPTGYTALDLIGFTDRGDYDPSAYYVKNDLVHDGVDNIWRVLIDDTHGVTPAEGLNYTIFIRNHGTEAEEIIAPVESNPAAAAHAVGTQLIYDGALYEVTTAIAVGDSLVAYPTSGYNIKPAGTVASQIQTLTNNKVNVSDIANNLTTTANGKVLDARQGKTLNDKEQATRNSIAPTEDGTKYSKSYSKGDEFYRNGTLYKVTASSVNTSTAINTGSGGNATSAGSITSQINPLLYYQTGTASNGWTDTTGTWTVTRKGNVVEVQIDLAFSNNLAALQALHIRDMPSWAKPSTKRSFTRKIPVGSEIVIEFRTDNSVYVTAYSPITAGGYNFYDTITYLI